MRTPLTIYIAFLSLAHSGYSQPCVTPGQTPSTAIEVCGVTSFTQSSIPECRNSNIHVSGCSTSPFSPDYVDKDPFWYRFTCSSSGSLQFMIIPHSPEEDFDWQLFDITGRSPNDVYTDTSLIVAANWAGSMGNTGASPGGVTYNVCASENERFTRSPLIIEGHEYLLLVSRFYFTNTGYTLTFGGGTAVISDPGEPALASVTAECNPRAIRLKLDNRVRCNSLTATGSEFYLLPAAAAITAASVVNCSGNASFDEVILTLSNPIPNGNYRLFINDGIDGNTLTGYCGRAIPAGQQVGFEYNVTQPQPVFADSIAAPGCSPISLKIHFPKKIDCSTVAEDGSNFVINGPSPVTIINASGDCVGGFTRAITIRFAAPIFTKGDYELTLKAGTDGTTIVDECDRVLPSQILRFKTQDTVVARIDYSTSLGCRLNTFTFSHDGTHDVNNWTWIVDYQDTINTQSYVVDFPASGTNNIQLLVHNGTCRDTAFATVMMNNQVKADFELPAIVCPGQPVKIINTSSGTADKWLWTFENTGESDLRDPMPRVFPQANTEREYAIKLKVSNNAIQCSDSIVKLLRVLNNCIIAVPAAFTPNNDGLNDFLYPLNATKALELEFRVFNRWGQLVFASRNWHEKWDGTVNGTRQPAGMFAWVLRYTDPSTGQKVLQKGTTLLIR